MNLHLKKIALLLGSVLFLAACQPNGPSIESLQKLRDVDSGVEITNSHIKSVSSINETLSLYDIEGMFKYRDGRYGYLTDIGNIKIYTPFNGEETAPFNASVIASEQGGSWDIVSENLPQFSSKGADGVKVLNHQTLFANSVEHMPGVFTHNDGSSFMLDNKALDKNVKRLIKEYETLLKQNLALDEKLSEMELALEKTAASTIKAVNKAIEKEKLSAEEAADKAKIDIAAALKDHPEYSRIMSAHKPLQEEIQALHQKMPALWDVAQCYETNYRFYGRICNQIASINRDYLPKIRYVSRPDAKAQFMDAK